MVVNKAVEYIKKEKLLKKYFIFIIVLFVTALNYNFFLAPFKIVAGGSSGLALIINNVLGMRPSTFILVFQLSVLLISYFVVGFKKSSSAFIASLIYPLFVEITSPLTAQFAIGSEHIIVVSIIAGVISGVTTGHLVKLGLSQGGIILIAQMIYEKFKLSTSKVNTFINLTIILIGGLYFGIETLLCAIILTVVSEMLFDKVLLGISSNKIYYIVTSKEKEITEFVLNELKNSVTIFDVSESKGEKKVLMLVVNNSMYFKVSESIKKIDNNIFFSTVDAYHLSVKK